MRVEKNNLSKSQIEIKVELSLEEFEPYIKKGAEKVSQEIKIEGFRPGKAPYDILKQKIGEMTILEEAARIAINKNLEKIFIDHLTEEVIGQPQVDISKLAPGNPLEFKIVVSVLPSFELGKYKGLDLKRKEVEVSDQEADKALEHLREMRVKEAIADKKIEQGDKVLININMYLDKVPLEGGQSKDTAVIIGKDYLVPGFDKKIIGAKKGDKREFSLLYPKDHYQKNIAGKMVEFAVEIKEVYKRELPELNDEFAKTLGAGSMVELKEDIVKNMKEEKKLEAEQKLESEIIEKIVKNIKFEELPETLINSEARSMIAELEQTVVSQGGKFEDYLSSIGKTKDQLLLDMTPNALSRVKGALLIREIAKQEKIQADDKEIEEKLNELLEQYKGYKGVEEKLRDPGYKHFLRNSITNRKVLQKLKEWNADDGLKKESKETNK
jgi:trigger factor